MKRFYWEFYGSRALVFDRTRSNSQPETAIATCTHPADADLIVGALNAAVPQ